MILRRLPALLAALLLLPALMLAKPVRNGSVSVELVAADTSIQPGQPFWVAVKLDHDPHWHSYWINAGTGYPTSINWTLPEGYSAGPIVWPAPHVVKDTAGKVTGNGYEGTAFLFTQITPPANVAPGASATLVAAVEWLMCKDVCMPGDAKVSLTLPVSAEKPGENTTIARLFNNAFADLPEKSAKWTVSAQRKGERIILTLNAAPGNTHKPEGLHYFDEAALVDYAADQNISEDGGSWVIELAADAAAPEDAAGLKGVLIAKNGFKPASGYGGLPIDAPFKKPAAKKKDLAAAADATPPAAGGTAAGDPATGATSLVGTLFLALMGGLVLNLMPCVFPVLGIKIMGFVNQSGSDKAKVVQHGLAFTAGVLVSFWALAGLLLFLRAGGSKLGWGFQLQSPAFVFGMAVFLLIFALNMSGLFEVGLSATGAGAELQAKEGLGGSFFTGALATLVATPCSAPFLAPALGAALSLSAVESILVFTSIAVGLALPYLLLSIFPQAIKLLPRPGAWMETFKQFMSFPLYATVGWLLWVLAGQTAGDDNALLNIAFAFVLVAMAAWAYGRFGQAFGKPTRQLVGRALAAVFFATGLWLGWPQEAKAAATTADGKPAAPQLADWEKWSPAAVEAALAAGRPVYVDFTARWCATCQTNKKVVFASQEVVDTFIAKNVVRLKADWTNRDAAITEALAKWQRSAVPFNLIYWPGKKEPVILPELLTPGIVLDHLAKAEKG
jgi:thiol:disulfide interchange protein DsbD